MVKIVKFVKCDKHKNSIQKASQALLIHRRKRKRRKKQNGGKKNKIQFTAQAFQTLFKTITIIIINK